MKLDVTQNGSKRGLAPLLEAMLDCRGTLKELSIQDNKSINRAIPELENCISNCLNLEVLNISDLNLKKKSIPAIASAIIQACKVGGQLKTLIWNYDLSNSFTSA